MQKYETKPKWVEAVQYDGTWESLKELKKIDPCSITCDNHNHYFNNIRLTKDCWIVKQLDIVESHEAGKKIYEYIVMRDDQFAERYITNAGVNMKVSKIEEEIVKFNKELKNVRNIEQLLNLLNKAINESKYGPYHLQGKRRGYEAYSFSKYPHDSNKVHYLYNDGISTGLSRFENLYKVLSFKE